MVRIEMKKIAEGQVKTDVSKLTPQQCEELERRAMRGQIITF